MASTGKKGKKAKWIPASITDIIAEPTTVPAAMSWADETDDATESTFGYASRRQAGPVVLPSASRAARGGLTVDDDSIPRRPPYSAYICNLPYDVDESAIGELFDGMKIQNLRLPREGDRLKGYGYVDFEDRESLVDAMNITDPTISGRKIRIEVSTQDNQRMGAGGRMGGRMGDREREYDPERTSGDWRSGPRVDAEPQRSRAMDRDRPPRERDGSEDNRPGGWRGGDRPEAPRSAYGGRDSFGRDRDRGFDNRDREREVDTRPGAWRGGDRPAPPPERERPSFDDRERGYGRDGFRERDGERDRGFGRDGFRPAPDRGERFRDGDRGASRGFGERRGFGDRDRDSDRRSPPREDSKLRERPKLNLLPRTLPVEQQTAPAEEAEGEDAVEEKKEGRKEPARPKPSATAVFGAAKPVDTAAKEREIEERLRKQEEGSREKDRWTRRADDSRAPPPRRNDDRSRDSRPRDRERRDYSGEDKGDTPRDDKDRRDYSHDGDRDTRTDKERDNRDASRGNGERDATSKERVERDRISKERLDRDGRSKERSERGAHSKERPVQEGEIILPQLKEKEAPNFAAQNKFSFLEEADAEADGE